MTETDAVTGRELINIGGGYIAATKGDGSTCRIWEGDKAYIVIAPPEAFERMARTLAEQSSKLIQLAEENEKLKSDNSLLREAAVGAIDFIEDQYACPEAQALQGEYLSKEARPIFSELVSAVYPTTKPPLEPFCASLPTRDLIYSFTVLDEMVSILKYASDCGVSSQAAFIYGLRLSEVSDKIKTYLMENSKNGR